MSKVLYFFLIVLCMAGHAMAQQIPAPSEVNVSKGAEAGTVEVSWNMVGQAMGYYVQYSTNEGKLWLDAGKSNETRFVMPAIRADKKYLFRVAARIGSATGKWSNAAEYPATLSQASVATAIVNTDKLQLSWNQVAGAKNYLIEVSTAADALKGEGFAELTTTTASSYTAEQLEKGKTYHFRVVALTDSGRCACNMLEIKQ